MWRDFISYAKEVCVIAAQSRWCILTLCVPTVILVHRVPPPSLPHDFCLCLYISTGSRSRRTGATGQPEGAAAGGLPRRGEATAIDIPGFPSARGGGLYVSLLLFFYIAIRPRSMPVVSVREVSSLCDGDVFAVARVLTGNQPIK